MLTKLKNKLKSWNMKVSVNFIILLNKNHNFLALKNGSQWTHYWIFRKVLGKFLLLTLIAWNRAQNHVHAILFT